MSGHSFFWRNEDQGSQLSVQEISIRNIQAENEFEKNPECRNGKAAQRKMRLLQLS